MSDTINTQLTAHYQARDSVLMLRREISKYHRENSVIWLTNDNVSGKTYTVVTRVHESKTAGNGDSCYAIGRIHVDRDGKRVSLSSGLPVVKVISVDSGKMQFTPLTTSFKRARTYYLSDKQLAGQVVAKAFKLAAKHGWGYSELHDTPVTDSIDEIIEIEFGE